MQDFRHIKAWQRAHALSIVIRKRTRGFTRAGFADLRSQLNRSSGSMASTIVEGCGTDSNAEFARYLGMSIESASETEYHLLAARDFDLITPEEWDRFTGETIEIRKMTFSYRRKVLGSDR